MVKQPGRYSDRDSILMSKTDRSRVVVRYSERDSGLPDFHENISRNETASKLAKLKGWDFAGHYDPAKHYPGSTLFRTR